MTKPAPSAPLEKRTAWSKAHPWRYSDGGAPYQHALDYASARDLARTLDDELPTEVIRRAKGVLKGDASPVVCGEWAAVTAVARYYIWLHPERFGDSMDRSDMYEIADRTVRALYERCRAAGQDDEGLIEVIP
jgi:hypothetical protein